jgi:hypothetical protein
MPVNNTPAAAAVQLEKTRRDELHKEKDKLQGEVAELGGMVKSQQRLLDLEKVRAGSWLCLGLGFCLSRSTYSAVRSQCHSICYVL